MPLIVGLEHEEINNRRIKRPIINFMIFSKYLVP
jgi:hypothetical protein